MPRMRLRHVLAVGLATTCLFGAMAASAQDKPKWRDGAPVFKKCKTCHSFRPGKHGFGSSLHQFFGKQAGSAKGFTYSKAMKAKRQAGLIWTDETLDAFLTAPKKFIPKTKMVFPGLKDPKDRRNVIAYVKRKANR